MSWIHLIQWSSTPNQNDDDVDASKANASAVRFPSCTSRDWWHLVQWTSSNKTLSASSTTHVTLHDDDEVATNAWWWLKMDDPYLCLPVLRSEEEKVARRDGRQATKRWQQLQRDLLRLRGQLVPESAAQNRPILHKCLPILQERDELARFLQFQKTTIITRHDWKRQHGNGNHTATNNGGVAKDLSLDDQHQHHLRDERLIHASSWVVTNLFHTHPYNTRLHEEVMGLHWQRPSLFVQESRSRQRTYAGTIYEGKQIPVYLVTDNNDDNDNGDGKRSVVTTSTSSTATSPTTSSSGDGEKRMVVLEYIDPNPPLMLLRGMSSYLVQYETNNPDDPDNGLAYRKQKSSRHGGLSGSTDSSADELVQFSGLHLHSTSCDYLGCLRNPTVVSLLPFPTTTGLPRAYTIQQLCTTSTGRSAKTYAPLKRYILRLSSSNGRGGTRHLKKGNNDPLASGTVGKMLALVTPLFEAPTFVHDKTVGDSLLIYNRRSNTWTLHLNYRLLVVGQQRPKYKVPAPCSSTADALVDQFIASHLRLPIQCKVAELLGTKSASSSSSSSSGGGSSNKRLRGASASSQHNVVIADQHLDGLVHLVARLFGEVATHYMALPPCIKYTNRIVQDQARLVIHQFNQKQLSLSKKPPNSVVATGATLGSGTSTTPTLVTSSSSSSSIAEAIEARRKPRPQGDKSPLAMKRGGGKVVSAASKGVSSSKGSSSATTTMTPHPGTVTTMSLIDLCVLASLLRGVRHLANMGISHLVVGVSDHSPKLPNLEFIAGQVALAPWSQTTTYTCMMQSQENKYGLASMNHGNVQYDRLGYHPWMLSKPIARPKKENRRTFLYCRDIDKQRFKTHLHILSSSSSSLSSSSATSSSLESQDQPEAPALAPFETPTTPLLPTTKKRNHLLSGDAKNKDDDGDAVKKPRITSTTTPLRTEASSSNGYDDMTARLDVKTQATQALRYTILVRSSKSKSARSRVVYIVEPEIVRRCQKEMMTPTEINERLVECGVSTFDVDVPGVLYTRAHELYCL